MKNGDKAGGKAARTRRRKTVMPKRRKALRSRRRSSLSAGEEANAALLRRERDEALEQQRATSEVLHAISNTSSDTTSVLGRIAESVARLLNVTDAEIVMRIQGDLLKSVAKYGPSPNWPVGTTRPLSRDWVTGRAVIDGTAVHVPDLQVAQHEFPQGAAFARQFGHRTTLGVPLLCEGSAIGAILIRRMEVKPFTDRQIELVSSFASQAVIAIENARLLNETKESLEQQTATSEVLQVINSSPGDLEPVFDAMLDKAMRLCEASFGGLAVPDGELARWVASRGVPEAFDNWLAHQKFRLSSLLGPSFRDRSLLHVLDVKETEGYRKRIPSLVAAVELGGARTCLLVPMVKDDALVGVIVLYRQEVRAFSDKQIALLQNFAAQAVIAIENARLLTETREALERQTATAEVLQVINSSPGDLTPVFETILEKAHSFCGVSHGSLQLYDGEKFQAVAAHGIREAFANQLRQGFVPGPNHPSQQLLEGARFAQVPDCAEIDDPIVRAAFEISGIRTVLLIPLRKEGSLLGQIAAARRDVNPFSEKEIALLENFAAQAVIAMENARLFEQVQAKTRDLEESLQQQTATADVLKVISRSVFDLEAVLKALVGSAVELTGAFSGAICIRDGETFRYRAGAGPGYSEKLQRYLESTPVFPGRGSIPGRVLLSGKIEEIPDVLEDSEYKIPLASLGLPARALLGVPLLGKQGIEGSLTLVRRDPGRFAPRIIELVQTFADQAVIAIENARLFEEVQARTRELSELLQQQTATAGVLEVISRSAFDLQTVFNTVAESAVRLCGADRAFIFRFDGELLRMVVAYNASAEFTEFVRQNPIRPGRHSGSARAALERRTVQIVDVRDDAEYSYGAKQVEAIRTLLGVPILKGDELFGVMMIYRLEVRAFTERQIALVETFANQAAIAIENVRLFEAEQRRTVELAKSLDELRTAQDRLVQTEKLASLGQLTAGIAHEIKNPLNFVNNFSALSTELTGELHDVLTQEKLTEKGRQEVDELTALLKDNLEKVVQHGKRANSIVKNMLLHSREGSGEHRQVEINAIIDESLNLAYHGARAEKQGFNITLERDFDPAVGVADIYPQDVTRVLLNLISNGLYAATQRARLTGDGFEPKLKAVTRNLGDRVEVRIRDNGTGIPPEIQAKIFNPFFTTKPAGEGTGLGLSMSHDIVVKQHGGTIDVVTEPGSFTEFIITLPRAMPAQAEPGGQGN